MCLNIEVPPTIIDSKTSQDIIVEEGSSVNMTCEALGSPEPRIMWKREDNKMIRYDVGEGENQGIMVSCIDYNKYNYLSLEKFS